MQPQAVDSCGLLTTWGSVAPTSQVGRPTPFRSVAGDGRTLSDAQSRQIFPETPTACHSCENAQFAACPVTSVAAAVWMLFLIRPEPPSPPSELSGDARPPSPGAAGRVLTPRGRAPLCRQPAGCRVLEVLPGAPAQPRRKRAGRDSPLTRCAEVILALSNSVNQVIALEISVCIGKLSPRCERYGFCSSFRYDGH